MRLLKLTANQPSFHTVRFNESGISLIVAKNVTNDEKTHIIALVNLLLLLLCIFVLAVTKLMT